MKIIITESKLDKMVVDYLNDTYDTNNIGWTYGIDDWGNEVDYAIEFYTDDYDDGDNTLFKWYGVDYWDSEDGEGWGEEYRKDFKSKSPILIFENNDVYNTLTGYFQDKWKQPFIGWFWDKFKVPVKTIGS